MISGMFDFNTFPNDKYNFGCGDGYYNGDGFKADMIIGNGFGDSIDGNGCGNGACYDCNGKGFNLYV